jgi:Rrf2 family protein
MQFTAKADYALRAATFLATTGPGPVKSEAIAAAEDIPLRFLHNILAALTRAGILSSLRGAEGGYELTRSRRASRRPTSSGRSKGRSPP